MDRAAMAGGLDSEGRRSEIVGAPEVGVLLQPFGGFGEDVLSGEHRLSGRLPTPFLEAVSLLARRTTTVAPTSGVRLELSHRTAREKGG